MLIFFYKIRLCAIVFMILMVMAPNVGTSWGRDKVMPEFQLPGIGDSPSVINSKDLLGKTLIVNFWATWCPPCRKEIPSLIRLQTENKDKEFTVLGISMDKSSPDKIARFVNKIGVNYPVALGDSEVSTAFGAKAVIPSSYLVDSHGVIIKQYPGYTTYEKMANDLKELLR